MPGTRIITLRRDGTCARCSQALAAGLQASWDAGSKTVTCIACVEAPPSATTGTAGASARARAEQLRAEQEKRRRKLKERRPILGRIAIAAAGPATAGASYAKGAVGEEKLGATLDRLTDQGLLVLHDRRRPRTTANIDHLVVTPNGVWVVDAKRYKGLVTKVDKGGWRRADLRLVIGGRDRTSLVDGVQNQLADVRRALDAHGADDVPIHGALCFVDAEFRLFAKPFEICGILVTWGKALRERLLAPGPLDAERRALLYHSLASSLPPASST